MFKIKFCLISAAVITGVFGAFANRSKTLCENQPQFFKFGSSYYYAGDYGVDYICQSSAGTCTYYQPNPFNPDFYAPCRTGTLQWLNFTK